MKVLQYLKVLIVLPLLAISGPSVANEPDETALIIEVLSQDGSLVQLVELSMLDLQSRPAVTFETSTKWTEGLQKFTGVRLHVLLQELGLNDGEISLLASNDYRMRFGLDEVRPDGAIIAYEMNERPMSRRDYGPLWLVYDYDSDPVNQLETIYTRSVWQLVRISVTQ